jgi:hypothetical protein
MFVFPCLFFSEGAAAVDGYRACCTGGSRWGCTAEARWKGPLVFAWYPSPLHAWSEKFKEPLLLSVFVTQACPLLVKIAPDLVALDKIDIAAVALEEVTMV